jgi:hypothetical protein
MAERRYALIGHTHDSVAEVNDLTSAVTWADVPDANITQSSVTQHQAALSITTSQISDYVDPSGTYLPLTGGTLTGNLDVNAIAEVDALNIVGDGTVGNTQFNLSGGGNNYITHLSGQKTYLRHYTHPATYTTVAEIQDSAILSNVQMQVNLGSRSFWGKLVGAYLQVGPEGGGTAGALGSTFHTDSAANNYRTYWAYDAYWDESADNWVAIRTTLGRKWMVDMGYHNDAFRVRYYNGTVSSPWADSAWTDYLEINGSGVVDVLNDVNILGGGDLYVYDTSNTDYIRASHDGTDAYFNFNGTTDVMLGNNQQPTGYYYFNTSGTDARLVLSKGAVQKCWFRHSSDQMSIRNVVHGGDVGIYGENTSGTLAAMLYADPDNYTWLYYAGNDKFRTASHSATGQTSGAEVKDHGGTYQDVGFNILPVQREDTSFTVSAGECGGLFLKDDATARTVTLEASSSTDFPVHGVMTILNANAIADITVSEGTGTTLYVLDGNTKTDAAGSATIAPGGFATLWREATDIYYLFGAGISA